MMKRIITFITLFSLLVIQSCRSSADEKMDEFREELQLKSQSIQKKSFASLETGNKVKIWQSKLNQILTQNISKEQRKIVLLIKDEIVNMNYPNYNGIRLIELGIEMAKITPQDEFTRMFSELSDYKREQSQYIKGENQENNYIVTDLRNFLNIVKKRNQLFVENQQSGIQSKLPDCTCRWTCGMYSSHDDKCNPTESGCGFFLSQPCTGTPY